MPLQNYQSSAAPAARDLLASNAGSELNGKNIALIIFVAIVPVLIVAGAVGWLLCCYSRGKGCGRRKKEDRTTTIPGGPTTSGANAPAGKSAGWAPSRPAQAHTRNDSMLSKKSNEKAPTLPRGFV
ncbi:hypothetical protein DPSP01_002372 [Paraphaeosphaeria sporulosa]|uniref:Uncharacterized protein n=1 Tax=Paraphaeosphaeria sporulosa TaxID=1460663 RepID=A0A177C0Z1_9PLEO|nr:uncharacterized protein CC84DRAFT_276596 [Paraphaeosphaeria sporulosa]OAG01086.1 hypothetical protein CC84DRAFT_276596 [Paraphaeosphaeria sporulosa]